MTTLEVFYYYILPLVIAGVGWIAVIAHERSATRNRLHPGE